LDKNSQKEHANTTSRKNKKRHIILKVEKVDDENEEEKTANDFLNSP